MNILIKFGYDGTQFSGYQRGNGKNSIEDTILSTLGEFGVSQQMRSAARTDRLVSAIANAFMINTEMKPEKVLGILNSHIDNMVFHSYSVVDDDFNPRHCDQKRYCYLVISPPRDLEMTLKMFVGKHDFGMFCRKDQRNPLRTIDSIEFEKGIGGLRVLFYGKSFVWEQLRSIIGYALINTGDERDPFSHKLEHRFVAPPEPLTLEDIQYNGTTFRHILGKAKNRSLEKTRVSALLKANLYSKLASVREQN